MKNSRFDPITRIAGVMRQKTTGLNLDSDEALIGLADYGLFAEKMPPCLTSAGLSEHMTAKMGNLLTEEDGRALRRNCDDFAHSAIRYQSLRDINVPRHMAVPHPESHLAQCLLIKRAWREITEHCSSHRPFSRIFVRKLRDTPRVFEMNYRGSEHWDCEEQELRFQTGAQFVVHTDIAKCFPSIYTHSISWALLGKPEAKRPPQRNDYSLTGNYLDKSCQITADQQTNGLHIGPHTSNVISEIILTRVDTALFENGYRRVIRHIDDYRFFARDYEEAEAFIRELSMQLREYELHINEGKTRIVPLPQPAQEDWVRELNSFRFPDGELAYSEVRLFLDLALRLVEETGKSSVLNYAIQRIPERLNNRAKQMFSREVINLALRYPYLAPVLDKHFFEKHGIEDCRIIRDFCRHLLEIGIRRIYPDAIAHALYYAIKFDVELDAVRLLGVVPINDCISLVMLWEYADGSGSLLRTYVWGQGIDNLLSFTDHTTSNTYYAIKDHQNTVIALVDDTGVIVESYEYSAYGETKVFNAGGTEISESALGNRYTFQGREIDWATGLYYFRARWYDSATGRWLSKDPIGIAGGLNLYVFCGNNPCNFIDPLGLEYWVSTVYRGDDATIVTDGKGGIRPYIPEGFGKPGSLDYRIAEFHEQAHMIDAYMAFAEQGGESLERLQNAIPGQGIKMSESELVRTEANAWRLTLHLIQMMINDANHPFRQGATNAELKEWEKRATIQLNHYQGRLKTCSE